MKKVWIAIAGIAFAGTALAKLPEPSPEAKAKAAEAKEKAAWTDKVAAYQLCKAQDRTAVYYRKDKNVQPKADAPASAPCQDPGPFVPAAAATAAAPAASATAAATTPTTSAAKPVVEAKK
ncbi:hypothetical protein [Noviherbaspirillum pedocola]|uniref:Uncharacterized protein n=1 Tax=Noviherbaspirillum pedocola TaxID=2801341 RepID=A0A934SPT7_9BURK|nr:hypothetical protein [Noviherbaspirillum pedocola]MBK4734506.1 hypothetical protein [Noviherbaspirillum pedocola]